MGFGCVGEGGMGKVLGFAGMRTLSWRCESMPLE